MYKLVDTKTGLTVSLPVVRTTKDGQEVKVVAFREPIGDGVCKDGLVVVSSTQFSGMKLPSDVGLRVVWGNLHHIMEGMIVRSYDFVDGRDSYIVGQVQKIGPLPELGDATPRYHIRVIVHVCDEGCELDEVVPFVYPPINGLRLATGEVINNTEPNWLTWE